MTYPSNPLPTDFLADWKIHALKSAAGCSWVRIYDLEYI